MKEVIERNFPYPILLENGGDFLDASFEVDCKPKLSNDEKELILIFNYSLKCPFIEKLINEGKVCLFINIEQRIFRKSALLNSDKEIRIPISNLSPNYNLEIMPMIVARNDFSFKYEDSMDKIFSFFDEEFNIKRGQIVGYGNFLKVELPTSSKIGSIFTVSKLKDTDNNKNIPYIITLDTQVIDIKVKASIYDSFFKLKDTDYTYRKLLYSTFVYPAVQLAVLTILQDPESVRNNKWCVAICNKINKNKGIDILNKNTDFSKDEILEYTNIVLDTLLEDAFNDIEGGTEE